MTSLKLNLRAPYTIRDNLTTSPKCDCQTLKKRQYIDISRYLRNISIWLCFVLIHRHSNMVYYISIYCCISNVQCHV